MKIVAYDDNTESKTYGKMVEVIASEERLQIVKIPGHYWHGTKTLGHKPSYTIYFVNNLYDMEPQMRREDPGMIPRLLIL